MNLVFEAKEVKRLIGLKVYQDGVKNVDFFK